MNTLCNKEISEVFEILFYTIKKVCKNRCKIYYIRVEIRTYARATTICTRVKIAVHVHRCNNCIKKNFQRNSQSRNTFIRNKKYNLSSWCVDDFPVCSNTLYQGPLIRIARAIENFDSIHNENECRTFQIEKLLRRLFSVGVCT